MENINCKRCLSKETNKNYEKQLGQQFVKNDNNSDYEKNNISQKMANIIDNSKEDISIIKSDLNNIEKTDQNALDEDKVPLAPQQQMINPIIKEPIIIQAPLLTQKGGYFERNYPIIKNYKRGMQGHSVTPALESSSSLPSNNKMKPDDIESRVGLNQVSNNLNKDNLGTGITNKLASNENIIKNCLINNLSNAKNNVTPDDIISKLNNAENNNVNQLGNSTYINKNSEINVRNSNKDNEINSIKNLILLDDIKSNYILRKLIQNLNRKTLLKTVKYNKHLRCRLNIDLKEYKTYLQTEIELKLFQADPNLKPIKFINYEGDKKYYHIYYNDNEQEGKKEEIITKVKIIIDRHIISFKKLFYGCEAKEINFIRCNRTDIINMNSMFKECKYLEKLNISNLKTGNVTNMGEMFNGCTELKELDVSKFDTSNVKKMNLMFANCKSLEQLDLQNFNTSKVSDMSYMFLQCISLKKISLENFNTKNVINMRRMFYCCYSLTDLDISKFNFENLPIIYSMFGICLKSLKHKIRNQVILEDEAFY